MMLPTARAARGLPGGGGDVAISRDLTRRECAARRVSTRVVNDRGHADTSEQESDTGRHLHAACVERQRSAVAGVFRDAALA